MKKIVHIFIALLFVFSFLSCDKGYQVRFSNFFTEEMDSVIIGEKQVIFTNIPLESTTEFKKITRGQHSIRMITRSQQVITGTLPIPSDGTGNRTVQIDAIKQISILEE